MKLALPDGWTIHPVNSFGRVMAGLAISPRKTCGKLRPYLRVANILDGYLNLDDVKHMLFTEDEFETFRLQPGDILLNEGQSLELVGRPAMYNGEIPDCCFQNSLVQFRAAPTAHQPFFYQLFRWLYVSGVLASIASRTTSIAHLGVSRFAGVRICVPPLAEQRRIAEILSTWDAAIEQTEKLLDAKQRRKRALAQQLLTGKRRLRGSTANKWKSVSLGEVAVERSERNNGRLGAEAVRAVNKTHGMIPMKESVIGESLDRYKVVSEREFAYNPMRINIGSICRWESSAPCLVSPDYVVFGCIPSVLDSDFLNHFRRSHRWEQFMSRAGAGGVRTRIYFDHLAKQVLHLPPLAEQQKIAALLNTAELEIVQLKDQLAALRRQKQGLMQVLLTGKVRTTSHRVDARYAKS